MRVMLDTNVLISMIFFPGARFDRLLEGISKHHTLVLSSFVVNELMAVTERKFPRKKDDVDRFLASLSYELAYTPLRMKGDMFKIRDMNDYPVLYTAILENVDVLITGDKDFADLSIEKPEILTPAAFSDLYLS
ncbi:MAG: putative toxin-antitoxin system toxin component, PIN family [Eubacteriales bacterium]|nr:putative toxin-antitoxin system toxin component, PIN family [Eubacteriales bacterium]